VRPTLWILVAGAVAASGCGEKEEPVAAAAPAQAATATPTATAKPPARARSVRECLALWNADEALGSTPQVSHTDFLAELARKRRTPVSVVYQRPDCYVVVPVGTRRIAWFAAIRGRAPYTNPERRNLKPGESLRLNGRVRRDGRIDLR